MTTYADEMVYEAERGGDAYIQVFDDRDEAIDGFSYTADPSRKFFDMTGSERWGEYVRYDERFTAPEPDLCDIRSVEEYEERVGRPIAPYDEWLPNLYDESLETNGWKRVSDWNERGVCKVICVTD